MSIIEFEAMGTTIQAWGGGDGDLMRWFEDVEAACSRFLDTSELSRINASAPGRHRVSPLMRQVLEAAVRAREITDGVVDIGVGSALTDWGYDRTFAQVGPMPIEPRSFPTGSWGVEGDSVRIAAGTRIDLGGIAKGWTCDRAVETGMASVVSAGGDIRSSDPATVATIAEADGTGAVARVALGVGALATSSVARRRWRVGSRVVSHIVDPRSMRPVASPIVSASVMASTAVDAEAGAKAVLIHGVDGLAWADAQDWIECAIAVWEDGAVYATGRAEWVA